MAFAHVYLLHKLNSPLSRAAILTFIFFVCVLFFCWSFCLFPKQVLQVQVLYSLRYTSLRVYYSLISLQEHRSDPVSSLYRVSVAFPWYILQRRKKKTKQKQKAFKVPTTTRAFNSNSFILRVFTSKVFLENPIKEDFLSVAQHNEEVITVRYLRQYKPLFPRDVFHAVADLFA